jgi:hypothetical protein
MGATISPNLDTKFMPFPSAAAHIVHPFSIYLLDLTLLFSTILLRYMK